LKLELLSAESQGHRQGVANGRAERHAYQEFRDLTTNGWLGETMFNAVLTADAVELEQPIASGWPRSARKHVAELHPIAVILL
jgi:hypothetical protein